MISELDRLARLREQHASPESAAIDRVRRQVMTGLAHHPRPARTGLRWRLGVPVGLTAAAVAAIVGATVAPGGVAQRPPAPPSPLGSGPAAPAAPVVPDGADAGQVMRLAAQTASAEQPIRIGPTQYIYRRGRQVALASMIVGDGQTLNLFAGQNHQSWLDPRNGLRPVRIIIEQGTSRRPVTPKDAALAAKVGYDLTAPPDRYDSNDPGPKQKGGPAQPDPTGPPSLRFPTPEYLAKLPTDPTRLLATLRAAARPESGKWSTDKIAFGIVADLFTWGDPILSPRLRSGLLGAVALMPAVSRVTGQVDLAGRKGIAVGIAERGERSELILDPRTLHPIGTRTVGLKPAHGIPAGPLELSTFDFAVVDKAGQTS